MTSKLRNLLSPTKLIYRLPVAALTLAASAAFAAVPPVVVDSQSVVQTGLNAPQSIAVAPNHTYYVANSGTNQVIAYTGSSSTVVNTAGVTLVSPQAVAVDTAGDLFIGDSPSPGIGRVTEVSASGAVTITSYGGPLKDVTALATATVGLNTIVYIADDLSQAIYTVTVGSATLTNLNLTGLPSNVLPAALALDSAGDLFIADFNSTLYEVSAGSTTAQIYFVPGFTVYSPTGLSFDSSGNLYILTLTSTSPTPSQPIPVNIIEVPGGNVANAFEVPVTGLQNPSGLALDPSGYIYVPDYIGNNVTEIVYGASIGLSQVPVNSVGPAVTLNYELNASENLVGFRFLSQGDLSTEVQTSGTGTCIANQTTGSNGGAITPSNPFNCQQSFSAVPTYPGLRYGAIELKGAGGTTLASTLDYSTGLAGASVVYPLTASKRASGFISPQGMAVSGLNRKLYVVDASVPAVYSVNSPTGTKKTVVSTAPVVLSSPSDIAINGQGDLYIADMGLHAIVVVPSQTGQTPYTLNPGGFLLNPLTVAFDTTGNLFVGDLGPAGFDANPSVPAYIVEIPAGGGAPFKLNTGSTQIFFPAGLAADPYTGAIVVGDEGYLTNSGGASSAKVIEIPAGGGTPIDEPGFDGSDPVGVTFDPADEFYVLDGVTGLLTVVPPTGPSYVVGVTNNFVSSPSALASTAGGQSFVVANDSSSTSNDLIYLNGLLATLDFGSLPVGQVSPPQTGTINNIGSSVLTLGTPWFITIGNVNNYDLLYSTICNNGTVLQPATNCAWYLIFTPVTIGTDDLTSTFQTNGYLPASSVVQVNGRGTR